MLQNLKNKKLGRYEIEDIDNPCFVTPAVNPKEYFKFFSDDSVNKAQRHQKWIQVNGVCKLWEQN